MNEPSPKFSKIVKPSTGFLDKFKSKKPPTIAGVETLLTPLPVLRIGEVDDFTRLHQDEDNYWTGELCFVAVPVIGEKRDILHLIDEDVAVQYLHAKKIKRQRLALAARPGDKLFLCIVPSQNLEHSWNKSALTACEQAKTLWIQAVSRKAEGIEAYKIERARDPDAFPDPNWPTRSIEELIQVTFNGCMIEADDHPGLLRLIGGRQNMT